jgi:hypothetical protein
MSCSKSTPVADDAMHTSPTLISQVLRYFWTPQNVFGLSRKHYGMEHPLHDPEYYVTPQDLCEINTNTIPLVDGSSSSQPFYSYPNQNSFSLGNWYWNQGIHKSQDGFSKLIDIVGDQDFRAADIRSTNWTRINAVLAESVGDNHSPHDLAHRWLGEDTGWKCTAISISVLFHHHMAILGPRSYLASNLYHRSIVSVIQEQVTNNDRHFHYEPYELLWKSSSEAEEIRVHGELYTSAAFLLEHKKLLQLPAEPGCDAPRAIVALMFWSDETHLMSFGNCGHVICISEMIPSIGGQNLPVIYATMLHISRRWAFSHLYKCVVEVCSSIPASRVIQAICS